MPERTTRYQKKRNIQSDQIKSKVVSQAKPQRPSPRTPQPQQRDPEREQRIVEEQQTLQSKDILTGRTIEHDQLGVEEESDSYKEGPQGFLEGVYAPTQQITQMPKDIIEGVPIENQAMRPSMIDLAIQPVIGTLAAAKDLGYTEKSWYSPVGWFDNKALPEFLNRNPDEQRDFFTGMSDNFGIIGDTVTNERWIDDVNKGVDFDQDGKVDMVGYDQTLNVFNPDSEIRKYPAYYIGSAIGEVPYFLSPAIAIRGPVQTAKILASATRIAGKASLSMNNINVTSKMGNAGKNIVKSVQKEQKNIGTDAPVNTKAANEGMDLLEKNIDNQIQVKENLSIKMSKEGLSDNKLTKTVDDLENEIAILRAEKADLRTSHTSALNKFNEIRNNYKSGNASIDEVDDARSRYITVVQRGVEDKVATTYKANNKDIIRKYEAISELHRVRTTTKIRELQKKVDDGNLTERQTQRTKSKIDKLERSLQDELPRADRVARAIEGAPDDAMAYVKKIVPKHRWSSLGREVEQTVDSQGIQVYGTKKTKYEDMYKRYDGNEVLAGIVYAMRKSREGLGFAFHKTEKSLTEQIQFKMRERVVTVGDASRPELGMISFRAGDSVEAAGRVKAAYGDVRASMARRDKIRSDKDAMKPDPKKDDFIPEDLKEAEMDVEAKMNVLSEIMGEYEPISDFKVTQLVDDADGSKLITNYADVKRGKGDDFIKVEPTSDIQVTVATRIPDVQIEKLGKVDGKITYKGSVGKEMTVIAQKTDVRQIQSILGKDSTYLTKGNEWLFKSSQAKDPVSLRGGRSLSQGNAYVQVPAGMKIEDYLFMQQRLGLDTPESIQVGIKKYKAWQKYNTPKNRKGYSKKAWRRVTKERGIYAPDTLEGGVLVPYKKLDSIPRKDIYGKDKSALSQSTVRVDLEQEFKMDGTTATLKLFPDEGSPTIDVGDVITNREIFEGRLRPDMVESDLSDIRNSRDRVRTDIANLSDEIVTLKKETEGIALPSGISEKNLGFYSPETKAQLLKGQKSIGEAKDYAKEKKVRLTELKNEIIALKGKLSGDDLEVLKQRVGELDGELTSMEYGLTTLDPHVLGLARQRHEWNSAVYSNKVSDDLVEEYNAIDQERSFAMSKYENIRQGRYTDTKSKQLQLDADIARLELQSKELAKKQTKTRDGAFDGITGLKKGVDQTLAIKKSMKANTVVREFEEIENITPKVAMTPEEAAKYNSSGTRVSVENIVAKLQAEKLGINKKKYELNQNAWAGIQYRKLNKYGTRTLEPKKNRKIGEMTKYLIMRDKDKRAYDEGVKSDIAIDNLLKDKIKKKESISLKETQLVGKQAELERTYTRLTSKEQQLEHVTKQFKGLEDFPGAISTPRGQLATWTEKTLAQQGGTTPVSKPLYFESGKRRFEIVTMVRAEKEDRLLALNVRRDSMIKQGYTSDTKQRLQVNKEISDFKADQSNYRLTAIDYDAKISGKGIERISESELMVMFKTETGAKAYKVLEDVQESLAKKAEPNKQPDGTINKSVAQRALGTILPTIKKAEGVIEQPIALVRSVTGGRVKPVYGKGTDYANDAIITDTRIITGDWKHYKLSAVLETTDKVGLLGASKGTYPVGVKVQQIYKMAKPTETNEPFRGTSAIERISTYRDSEVYIPIGQRFKDKALPVQVWDELERKMSNQPMKTNLRKSVVQQYLINIKNVELDVASKRADKIIRKVDGKDSEEFTNIIESVMTPDTFRRPTTFESVTSKGLTRKTPSGKEQVITPRFKKIWRTEVSPGVRKGFVDINEIERDIGVTFRTSGKGTVRDRGIAYIQDTFGMKVPTGAGNVREQIVRKALLEQARDKQPWHKFSRKNRKVLDSGTRVESAEELAILTSELKAIDEGTATSFGQKGKKVFKEPFEEKDVQDRPSALRPLSSNAIETKDEMILRIKHSIEAEEGVTFSEILSGDVRMQLQKRMNELKDKKSNVMNKGGDTTEINAEVSSILTTLSKDEKVKRTIDQRYFEKINLAKESRPQRKPYYAGFGSYTGATIGTLGSQAIPMVFAEEQQSLGVDLRPPTVSENTIQAPIQIQQPLTEQLTKISTEEARLMGQQSAFRLDVTPKGIQSSILTPALATGTSLATLPGLMLSSAQGQMYRYTTVSQIQPPPAQRQTLEVPRPPGLVPPAQRVTPPYVAGWPPWLENELDDRRKQKGKFKKKQKQFWTVPDQWWKPGYWQKKKDSFTGKYDYTGTGYGTFKGKEGKRLKDTWDMQ